MALEVYTQTDILNVLRATHVACEGSVTLALEVLGDRAASSALDVAAAPEAKVAPAGGETSGEELVTMYRRGFHTALSAVALAFGLVPVAHEARGQGSRAAVRHSSGAEDPLNDVGRLDFAWRKARG